MRIGKEMEKKINKQRKKRSKMMVRRKRGEYGKVKGGRGMI